MTTKKAISNNNNTSKDPQQFLFAKAIHYAERSPYSFIVKYGRNTRAAASGGSESATTRQLRDPYRAADKFRFEDAWRADPAVRQAINRKVQFTLGKRTLSVLDAAAEFPTEDLRKAAVARVLGDKFAQEIKNRIDETNRKVNFRQKLKALLTQSKVGGRAALGIEKDGDGMPLDLKILNWSRLGKVTIDSGWRLLNVQYTDLRSRENPDGLLAAEDMIYYTNLDYHISPDTICYGYSDVEPVAHVSESNRIIDEMDIKEINRSLWAGFGILKFHSQSDSEANALLNNFDPGIWNLINQDVEIEVHQIAHDLDKLIAERNENDKRILRGLGVPNLLIGFEDTQNRATAQSVLKAWQESVLEDERENIRDQIEPQWFDSLTALFSGKPIAELEYKVKLEFENIVLEDFSDSANVVIQLYNQGLIPIEKALKLLGFDDVIDEVKAIQQEREKQKAEETERQIEAMKQGNNTNNSQDKPFGKSA